MILKLKMMNNISDIMQVKKDALIKFNKIIFNFKFLHTKFTLAFTLLYAAQNLKGEKH